MKVRAIQAHDVLERDGDTVMLMDGRLMRLSPIGAAAWSLCRDWTSLEALARSLGDEFGVPADADLLQTTRDLVASLEAQGLLECDPPLQSA